MERPILMSGPLVTATLQGRKVETRRPAKDRDRLAGRRPYGQPGDRLWVRETWAPDPRAPEVDGVAVYRATDEVTLNANGARVDRWRPSIHMPRWASRLTLDIVEVRCERLYDIDDTGAVREGARRFADIPDPHPYKQGPRWSMDEPETTRQCLGSARMAFANVWIRLYGVDAWDANPWVWVVRWSPVGGAR